LITKTNTLDFFRFDSNYPSGDYMVDPRILYDRDAKRWVACAIAVGRVGVVPGQLILAVSTSDSPTNLVNGWTKYLLPVHRDGLLTDFTTMGLDGNGLYLRVLHFGGSGGSGNTNGGHTIVAIKKPEIYQGTLLSTLLTVPSDPPVWTIQPVVNCDPVATTNYAWFVAKGPPNLSSNYQGGGIWYHRLQWNGTNAAWAETNWLVLTDPPAGYRNYYDLDGTNFNLSPSVGTAIFAPQTGVTNAISLHDVGSRLTATVIRNGVLWTCQTVGLEGPSGVYTNDQSGGTVDRSGIQWFKLNVDAAVGALTFNTNGRIYDSGSSNPQWYHFPSVSVNCLGDLVAGFSGSSLTNYIGAFWALRLANGSTPAVPRVIQAGLTLFTDPAAPRWGDFSATTLDPADDSSFWTVQQYADPAGADENGGYPWKTVIARIRPSP
jgi:hypothetical protein